MNWYRSSSIQLVISDLNEIAADLYRHRIRPGWRKGGNGVYDTSQGGLKYVLPPRLAANVRATFSILELTPDNVSLVAVSSEDPTCRITATVDARGRLRDIVVPGQAAQPANEEKPAGHRDASPAGSRAGKSLFFDDMS